MAILRTENARHEGVRDDWGSEQVATNSGLPPEAASATLREPASSLSSGRKGKPLISGPASVRIRNGGQGRSAV